VEYVVGHQMCDDCRRREAKDTWKAVVQVRQKVSHKKTFYYLEQLILRHGAHKYANNMAERPDGLDFFFPTKNYAQKFVEFLFSVIPARFFSLLLFLFCQLL